MHTHTHTIKSTNKNTHTYHQTHQKGKRHHKQTHTHTPSNTQTKKETHTLRSIQHTHSYLFKHHTKDGRFRRISTTDQDPISADFLPILSRAWRIFFSRRLILLSVMKALNFISGNWVFLEGDERGFGILERKRWRIPANSGDEFIHICTYKYNNI